MPFKAVLGFDYITISEAREILEKIVEKRREKAEILYETRKTLKYLRTFSKLPADKAKELVEELLKLPQLYGKKELAVKIADLMPRIPDEVRIIYAKERYTLSEEQIKEILEVVNKYRI